MWWNVFQICVTTEWWVTHFSPVRNKSANRSSGIQKDLPLFYCFRPASSWQNSSVTKQDLPRNSIYKNRKPCTSYSSCSFVHFRSQRVNYFCFSNTCHHHVSRTGGGRILGDKTSRIPLIARSGGSALEAYESKCMFSNVFKRQQPTVLSGSGHLRIEPPKQNRSGPPVAFTVRTPQCRYD